MTRSLNSDLRQRVIAAVVEGLSTREAARRFRVRISTVGSWCCRYRANGETAARKQGQPSRSKLDPHEGFILGPVAETADITLAEIAERLAAEFGVRAVPSTVWMLLYRRGITFKKTTAHASEQQRADVLRRRRLWFEGQLDLDPARLIFIDETTASTKMARLRGRSKRGDRCPSAFTPGVCRNDFEAAGYDPY